MKVGFVSSFEKILRKLIWHESWVYKVYAFFRYDIAHFVKNVWRFRKPLADHRWWDHHATLAFMEVALTHMADNLEVRGIEIDLPRMKKVKKIRRAVQLIKNYNEGRYIEMAEAELGKIANRCLEFEKVPDKPGYLQIVDKDTPEERAHARKVYNRARELEEAEWEELWQILRGQDHKEYYKLYKSLTDEEKKETDHYYKWFDGTGMKGWWD